MSDFKTLLAVGDFVTQTIVTISMNESIQAGARKMAHDNVNSLLIVDDRGGLVGIVTERDIVFRAVAAGVDMSSSAISTIMTPNPLSINHDESIFEARNVMTSKKVNHLIVTKNGKPLGVLTSQAVLGS